MKLLTRLKCAIFGHSWKAATNPVNLFPDWDCSCGAHEEGLFHPRVAAYWGDSAATVPAIVMEVAHPALHLVSSGAGRQLGMPPIPPPPPARCVVDGGLTRHEQAAYNRKHQIGEYAPHYLAMIRKYEKDREAYEAQRARSQATPQ